MEGDLAHTIRNAVREASTARNGLAVAAALNCIQPADLAGFFHESLPADLDVAAAGEGLPASPGAASGRIVLTAVHLRVQGLPRAEIRTRVLVPREGSGPRSSHRAPENGGLSQPGRSPARQRRAW